MLGGRPAPERMTLATDWPKVNEGGLELIEQWIEEQENPRLILIDTLKRFRPDERENRRLYDMDYDALRGISDLSHARGLSIPIVHHVRKQWAADHLEMASGSFGLTGSVDAVMTLRMSRGEADAILCCTSRDAPDAELALRWDADLLQWNLIGDAAEVNKSKARREVVELLRKSDKPLTPRECADLLDKAYPASKKLLWQMSRDGELKVSSGKYCLPDNPGNPGNPVTRGGFCLENSDFSVTAPVTGLPIEEFYIPPGASDADVDEICERWAIEHENEL